LEDRPHGRRGDGDAEPGEFAVDTAVAPSRVLRSETDDRCACFGDGRWPAGPLGIGPVLRDEPAMPTQDRVRSDEEDRPAVTAEHASERGEDRSVDGFEAGPGDLALQHRELV